jgi:predicted HAD superfamily Cof-like phosphohydrolase
MSSNKVLSDYEKVCEFNVAFDFPQFDDLSNEKVLKLRLDLIKEELDELKEAYSNNDTVEILDACADILYVAYGMAYTYKINSDNYLEYLIIDKNKTIFSNIVTNISTFIDIENTINMISIQYNKLEICCNIKHREQMIKALHDIIIYVYDLQNLMKYNSDKIFTIVHESNMSKLCISEEEAQQTVNKYISDYQSSKTPYDSPYYIKLDNGLYVIKNKSSGKALKSINYKEVKLNLDELRL